MLGLVIGASHADLAAQLGGRLEYTWLIPSGDGSSIVGSSPLVGLAVFGAIAAAMTGSIFSSDAWNNVTFIAGEMKNPKRNIGLSLFLGTLIVTIIYVSANVMYLSVMPVDHIASAPQDRVAVAAADVIFGHVGHLCHCYYDHDLDVWLRQRADPGGRSSLLFDGGRWPVLPEGGTAESKAEYRAGRYGRNVWWRVSLCISGKYNDLLEMISFVAVFFYALTVLGIFVLRRRKQPVMERPYKAFGYPVLPIIYILLATVFCVALIIQEPIYCRYGGCVIVLLGIPLYYIALSRKKA